MQIIKRALMGIAALGLMAALLSMWAPKPAHAVVAANVQIVNTAAAPVLALEVGSSARVPYQSTSAGKFGTGDCEGVVACQFHGFSSIPTGFRLVVENMSASLSVASANPVPNGNIENGSQVAVYFSAAYLGNPCGLGCGNAVVNQSVRYYVDGGNGPAVFITGDYGSGAANGFGGQVTIVGYLENCAVTGCPPIQN